MSIGSQLISGANYLREKGYNDVTFAQFTVCKLKEFAPEVSNIVKKESVKYTVNAAVVLSTTSVAAYSIHRALKSKSNWEKASFSAMALASGALAIYEIYSSALEIKMALPELKNINCINLYYPQK